MKYMMIYNADLEIEISSYLYLCRSHNRFCGGNKKNAITTSIKDLLKQKFLFEQEFKFGEQAYKIIINETN